MRFYKKRHQKIKKYCKMVTFEYAVILDNSDALIEYVCLQNQNNIINSSLYTKNAYYQLIITSTSPARFNQNVIYTDKAHINEIKHKSHIICVSDAVFKIKKAFLRLK